MSRAQLKIEIDEMGRALAHLAACHQQMERGCAEDTAQKGRLEAQKPELQEKLRQFKEHFQSFARECSSEWGAVYREFLLIINYVVELYQIRVAKLEVLNEGQRRQIEGLLEEKSGRCERQGTLGESTLQLKELSLEEDLSHCKKVKISDVIASYQSSVLTPAGGSLSSSQLGVEEEFFSTRFERRGKVASYGDELCFIGNASRVITSSTGRRGKELQEDKENISFVSSRKASKRGRSGARNREITEPSPSSKLGELRKHLFSNKKM